MSRAVSWNYTTLLSIVFLLFAATFVWRYFRWGGGWAMLKMMNKPIGEGHQAVRPIDRANSLSRVRRACRAPR